MTTIVQAHAAEDLLALVPQLIGFPPKSSLVVVLFAGRQSRGALRLSLPRGTARAEEVADAVAERALGFARRTPGVDAVVPVLYTDEPFGSRTDADGRAEPPGAVIIDAVIALARRQGFQVKDALCSAADGWASSLDPDVPAGGRPLALVAASPLTGVAPMPDELVTPELPGASPDERAAVERAVREVQSQIDRMIEAVVEQEASTPAGATTVVEHLDDLPAFFEGALTRGIDGLAPTEIGYLIIALSRAWASDVALMQWAFGRALGDELAEAEQRQGHRCLGPEDAEVFHRVARLLVGDGPRPDAERIQEAMSLLRAVAARTPHEYRPPLLCMLAWFSWALGQSTRAIAFLDQIAVDDWDDGLAPTIRAMVVRGHLPDWAFAGAPADEPVDASSTTQPAA